MELFCSRFWQRKSLLNFLLLPLSALYKLLSTLQQRWAKRQAVKHPVPIIVVGNISVGGSGKTPIVISIVNFLLQQGYKVAVVSRGYKSALNNKAVLVTEQHNAKQVGDEPYLIFKHTRVPVAIAKRRNQAVQLLLDTVKPEVIISDDGMQHYWMRRDYEIAVIDRQFQLGNKWLLPAGPLRESQQRLDAVDFIVFPEIKVGRLVNVARPQIKFALDQFPHKRVAAAAGIANPQRFFQLLKLSGLQLEQSKSFRDHHKWSQQDLIFAAGLQLIVTEKDAVKLQAIAADNLWYLSIESPLPDGLKSQLIQLMDQYYGSQSTRDLGLPDMQRQS